MATCAWLEQEVIAKLTQIHEHDTSQAFAHMPSPELYRAARRTTVPTKHGYILDPWQRFPGMNHNEHIAQWKLQFGVWTRQALNAKIFSQMQRDVMQFRGIHGEETISAVATMYVCYCIRWGQEPVQMRFNFGNPYAPEIPQNRHTTNGEIHPSLGHPERGDILSVASTCRVAGDHWPGAGEDLLTAILDTRYIKQFLPCGRLPEKTQHLIVTHVGMALLQLFHNTNEEWPMHMD